MIQTDQETLKDGDFVHLRFLKDKFYIGITTVFNADFSEKEFDSEELSNKEFFKNKYLYDDDLKHDDTFNVMCYPEGTDELEEKFHVNCILVIESAYKNIDGRVRFESQIRLKHRFTGMYLTFQPQNIDSGEKFTFQKQAKDDTIFIVHSVTKAKLESDPLEQQNVVSLQLYGQANDKFIGFNEQTEKLRILSNSEAIVISKFSPTRQGKFANNIFSGDIIRLLHIDTEGFLEANIQQTYLKMLAKSFNSKDEKVKKQIENFFSFQTIEKQYRFQIEKGSFNQTQQKTYGCSNIFLICKEDKFDGSLITRKDNFRLKHLASDTYFNLQKYEISVEDQIQEVSEAYSNSNSNQKQNKLNKLKSKDLEAAYGNQPLKSEEIMTFELKTEKVRYNFPVMIQSTDYYRVLKVKDILDRKQIQQLKFLSLQVAPLEQGLNILENWNPLRVANNTISDFIFVKDFRDMITQVIEYKLNKGEEERYIQLLKFTMIACQRMVNFLSQYTDEDEGEKEETIRKIMETDLPHYLNLRKFKYFQDMHLTEYMMTLNYLLWKKLQKKWDILVLGMKQMELDQNKLDAQAQQQKHEIEKIIKHDDDISENRINLILAILKLYEVSNEIINLSLQSPDTLKIVKDLQLIDTFVDQAQLSSNLVTSNYATLIKLHFKKCQNLISEQHIKKLVKLLEINNPYVNKLVYREKIIDIFCSIAHPKNERPVKTLQLSITKRLFGHLKTKNKDKIEELKKKDTNTMFRFYHEIDNINGSGNQIFIKFHEDDTTFGQDEQEKESWKLQQPIINFLTDKEIDSEIQLYKKILSLLRALSEGGAKEMQLAISQIFPMEVIIMILTQAIDYKQKLQFPKDVMALLMEILVEVYIKHHQLPQLYGTFNQQQKLKFNLDTLQEKTRVEGEKLSRHSELEDFVLNKVMQQRRLSYQNKSKNLMSNVQSQNDFSENNDEENQNQSDYNDDNQDEERGSMNEGSNSMEDDTENKSFTDGDGSQPGDNYSHTDSYISSNTNATDRVSLYGLQEKPKNSTQQDAIKDIINLILNIAKYITQDNFLKLVARGERKTSLLFISSMNLFKFYFLRMKKLDKEFQEIIGYDKMTEILKDFNEKYIIESNTSYKSMTNEENLHLGNALKSILDFVWIERDYKQVKYTGLIWTEVQEFAKQLILQNPYRVYKDGLRVLRVGFVSNQQAQKAKKSKQEKEQQKLSDVHKFLRIEEKHHTNKEILDRQFVKQIKASRQEPFQDMQLELLEHQKILKDYITNYDGEIVDFIPLEDQQKQDTLYKNFESRIQNIINELYEQEFKFTSSLHPSKFQALILDILGQEPQFCQSAMKILQKDFFPVSNIYENIQNAQISTTKGESHLIKHLDDLKKKFRSSLYPNLLKKITKETPSQIKKTIPLFVSKPDQLLPGLLEIFHVQFSKSIKCKYCGRWYTHTDVNHEQSIMKQMMSMNIDFNENKSDINLIADHKSDDSDMSDLDNAGQTNKKMASIENYDIHQVVHNCKNNLPQQYIKKIIQSRRLKKYTFGHLEEEKAKVDKEQRILNYMFEHINHNPQIPEQNLIDITKQNLMEQKGFNKIIFDFIKKTFFKIENESVLKGIENQDEILLLISYCYKFTYYYILNHQEHTKEIIEDDKLWECMTQMMSVKDNSNYNHIILDTYDIIIEVMKNEENINFLKEKSLKFLDLFLTDVCAMDVNKNSDKNFKILQMGNFIIKGLSAEDKDHIREYIRQFQLDNVIKESAKMFFQYDEHGNIKKFVGNDLFIQLFQKEYGEFQDEQERQYALYANFYQKRQYSNLNYFLELFEFLSSFVAFLPTEFSGLVINSTEKQNIVIQNQILNYIFDFQKPTMVQIKCYAFFINVYLYSQDLNEDNSLYVYLQQPENLKHFFINFENQKNFIEDFKNLMENCKYDDKISPTYLLKEALIVYGIIPIISNMINEKFIYLFFSQYLKLQKLHTSSYQKVLKSLSMVIFNNDSYRQCLIEESKDSLTHENLLQLKDRFVEQQTQGIGALSNDIVKKKLMNKEDNQSAFEDLNTLKQLKQNTDKNSDQYKSLKLRILEYKTREVERSKRSIIPNFIKEFKRLVNSICELGFHLPFFTKSDNNQQLKQLYQFIFNHRYINEKLKNNAYLGDRQFISVRKLLRYYEKLNYKGYNTNFIDISLLNVKKFLNQEIIPIALKAMKKELLNKHEQSFQNTFEEKYQYNQIITQINDYQLNEEFFFFMSPFEDLLLFLVYHSDTTVVDQNLKEKQQIEAANRKKFEEIIQKKYKAPKSKIKDIFGPDYYRIFERKNNISNILTYVFHYIESTLENLENKKMFLLAKNYIRVLQSILFKYGATCQKCEYYEFKYSKMKLKEEQIKEENQMTLQHIQDYLIEYYDAPRMVCSALMESYIQLDNIQNNKTYKESNNFLPYLIQIMKFANVLISNYNESGQEEFLNVIQGHHSAFMMKNQMVIFGVQKIMRYCAEKIKNGGNEEVQQTTLLAESMLKFFQDLCDGNNKNAQNFLRNQPNLLKSVNLVYEISVMADYFIENIKQQLFKYVNLQEKELKIFKRLFGKKNRDFQNSQIKKHKKFWNFNKTNKHRVDIIQPLIQCFKTIIELINGPNIENIKVIINTLSTQKINLTFEYLNSYFMKFDFQVPKTGQNATYYGCFALSQEYLKVLFDNNPEEALYRAVIFGQKGSENIDNEYEDDEDDDQNQIQYQNQNNLNSTYNSDGALLDKNKTSYNIVRPRSAQIQPLVSGIIRSNKIKAQVSRQNQAFAKTIVAKRSQLREIYKTRQFLMNIEQKKIKFTQTLYELEKSMLDYLNFLFQSRNSIESVNKADNSFSEYLNNFDYSLLLDNLQQRFDQKVESSYSSRVILAYYSVFLANLQNELNVEQNLIMEKFLLWENQDFNRRDHKKFIGSIEVVNESSQLQRIFFKIPKSVLRVWRLNIMKEKRSEIIDTVKRDNPEDKVKDLFDKFKNLEHMIEYQNYIYRIITTLMPKQWRDFSFYKLKNSNSLLTRLFILFNLIQNIFQIAYTQSNDNSFYYQDRNPWVRVQFEFFAYITIIIVIYLSLIEFVDDFVFQSIEVFYRKEDMRQQSLIIRYFTYLQKFWKLMKKLSKFLGSQTSFWVHCTIATTQILGYTYDSSFFAYGLIMIIWGIDFTKEIINAVFSHIDQVIGSILLSIIILYWFVIIAYNSPWNSQYGFESQMNCDTLIHCIQVHFDYGYLTPPIWELSPLPISGTIWTFFFNLFVNIILTAIISGIIIDTFGERREQKKQIKSDTLNKCFICNIEREEFERSRKDFNHHEIEEHNKYNYLFYNIAVKKMTPSTRTNIDDWIVKNNEDNTIKHIPIQRCLMLQQYANQDNEQFSTAALSLEFSQMRDIMDGMNNRFAKFEKNIRDQINDGRKQSILNTK